MEQNPELIRDKKDRAKWTAGARLAKSLVSDISLREEIGIGQSLALRAFASFGAPYPDEDVQRYVARVGKLVALQSERPSLPYSFAVVASEEPNALALPGGFVFVSIGLLRRLGSESELACILAHEICHVAQKHGLEIVERDRVISATVDFGAVLNEDVGQYRQFIDLTYQKLTTEGYDRRYEWIADEAGVRYAFAAGYHPGGVLPFLEESRRSGTPMAFEVFKTHPDPGVRIEKMHAVLEALGPYSATPKLAARYQREALDKLL